MKLVEFLNKCEPKSSRNFCLGTIYYLERYGNTVELTVEELRFHLKSARIPKASTLNIADILAKSGDLVDSPGKKGTSRTWILTTTGQKYVRNLVGLPEVEAEIEEDTFKLQKVASKIKDLIAKEYVDESIKCLSVGAYKASVVFAWAGAVRILQEKAFTNPLVDLNAAIVKHDPKAKTLKRIEDFAYIKDSLLLITAQELGILDKAEVGVLKEALDLRNRCGHPGKYNPGPTKVSATLEDLITIIFSA